MKRIILCACFLIGMAQWGTAQEQRRFKSPDERTTEAMAQMQTLKLDDSATLKVTAVFKDFYTRQQEVMRIYRNAENPNREAALESIRKLGEERDGKLQTLLNTDQYKKYLSDIQPQLSMRRNRGGGS